MKKRVMALAAVAAVFFAVAPASADSFVFSGSVASGFESSSFGTSNGTNTGTGTVAERYSWAGTKAEDSGSATFEYDSTNGVSGNFQASSSAEAGAGNYIKTIGVGAGSSSSFSQAGVSGGFSGSAAGSGSFTSN